MLAIANDGYMLLVTIRMNRIGQPKDKMKPVKTIYTGYKLKRSLRDKTYTKLNGMVNLNFDVEISCQGDSTSGLCYIVSVEVSDTICQRISNYLNSEMSPL